MKPSRIVRAVIYTRESSDEGVKNGNGLQIQLKECRAYAAAQGIEIVAELADEGISGRIPIAERPRGVELWRMIANRDTDAVIAARKDRYSRDEWGIELPTFLRHCTENNVQVYAIHEGGLLRADMAGRILASFGDIMGGEERLKNSKRMADGRRAIWENGILIPAGVCPAFGYRRISVTETNARGTERLRHDLVIDPEQAAMVRECYRLLIQEHLPARQIAAIMGRVYPSLRHPTKIIRILKNPIYKGEFHYGDFQTLVRPDLAIVDSATFEAAQEQLKQNGIASPRSAKNEYLLRGRLRCHCGRMLHARCRQGKHKRYDCPSYQNVYDEGKHEYLCFHATKLDDATFAELRRVLSNRELLHRAAREYAQTREDKIKPLQGRLLSYKAELAEAETDADEYVKRAGRRGISEELLTRYELEVQKALARIKEIKERITKIKKELETIPRYDPKEVDRIIEMASRKIAHGAPTFEQKKELVEWANLTGQVQEGKIEFTLEIGLSFDVEVEPRNLRTPIQQNPSSCDLRLSRHPPIRNKNSQHHTHDNFNRRVPQ